MIHSEIVQFLSEIDTNIFLSFNGIHSPFWDYFMSSFTGKIIWVPMLCHHIIHIIKKFPLEGSRMLCGSYRAHDYLCRPNVQQYHPPGSGTPASRQSGQPYCGYGIYRKRVSWRKLWFPIVPCGQFIGSCHVCSISVP